MKKLQFENWLWLLLSFLPYNFTRNLYALKNHQRLMRTKRGTKNGGVFYLETKKKGKFLWLLPAKKTVIQNFLQEVRAKKKR